MATVPKKGRKNEVLREERSRARLPNSTYLRIAAPMHTVILPQATGSGDGYWAAARAMTRAAKRPRMTPHASRKQARLQNLPSRKAARGIGRVSTEAV